MSPAVVWLIALKDLRVLARDKMALFWVFGFPLVFAVFLAAVLEAGLGGDTAKLAVHVVTTARGEPALRLERALLADDGLAASVLDEQAARERVRRGQSVAVVVIAPAPGVSDEAASGARGAQGALPLDITLVVDPAQELALLRLRQALERALAEVAAPPEVAAPAPPQVGARPLVRVERLATSQGERRAFDYVFAPAVLWGLIGCAACFAVSLVSERTRGTLSRLGAAPIKRSDVLLGKALACALACLAVAGLVSAVMGLAFSVRFESLPKLLLATVSAALCFSGITMLLSVLGKSEQGVAGAGWGALIVLAMLGGGMVPLAFMPAWLGDLGRISPVRWSIVALEGAAWRAFSYGELWLCCGVLLAIGAACFALGSLLLDRAFRY